MRKVLIIMASRSLVQTLADSLGQDYELTVCRDPVEAARLLGQDYDGLIMDPFLPGADGLALLEEADKLPSVILLLTRLINSYIQQAAQELGVGYLLPIPCKLSDIQNRLEDMFQKQDAFNAAVTGLTLEDHLNRLGFSSHEPGYKYLCPAILLYAKDTQQTLSKHIYPVLTKEIGPSIEALDNAIRRVIYAAWTQRNDDIWTEYFPDTSRCPSNKKFIAILAEKIT